MNMFAPVYAFLQAIGYTHPLHPTVTHLPIGLIFAAFVFSLVAMVFRRPVLFATVRHCLILALITVPLTVFFGLMDWQYFYAGAWLFPITAKVILAGLLVIVVAASLVTVFRTDHFSGRSVIMFGVCLLLTFGLGYFGGELVWGTARPGTGAESASGLSSEGAAIFSRNCSMCHHTDRTDRKVGPGLKGLADEAQMPVSGWAVTDENIRRQIQTPFADMPPFPSLTEEEIDALTAYIKSL